MLGPCARAGLDLNAAGTHCFYNVAQAPFSNLYPALIAVDGVTYQTGEHYRQWAKFALSDRAFADSLLSIPDFNDLELAVVGGGHKTGPIANDPDFKLDVLRKIVAAKVEQHPNIADELLGTGDKTIAFVDRDSWAGVQALDGIPTGRNQLGEVWMEARKEKQYPSLGSSQPSQSHTTPVVESAWGR